MESKKQQKREAFQDAWRTKRSVTLVYILLRASVILVMLAQIFNRNFENVFLCVLTAKHPRNHHPAVYLCGGDHG